MTAIISFKGDQIENAEVTMNYIRYMFPCTQFYDNDPNCIGVEFSSQATEDFFKHLAKKDILTFGI